MTFFFLTSEKKKSGQREREKIMSHGSLSVFDSYLNSRTGKSDDCKMVTFRFRDLHVCKSVGRRQSKKTKQNKKRAREQTSTRAFSFVSFETRPS